jgi:CHAT domain-containing protein
MAVSTDQVVQAVQEMVSAGVLPFESQEVIAARQELLLTDLADQILLAEISERVRQGAERAICIFETWRALLRHCRQEGLEAAFARQEEMKWVETALAAFDLSAGRPIRIIGGLDPQTTAPLDPASNAGLIAALVRPALPYMDVEAQPISLAFLQAELAYALAWQIPDPNSPHLEEAIQLAQACLPLLSALKLWRRLARAHLALGLASLGRYELSRQESDLEMGILNCERAGILLTTHYQELKDEGALNLGVYALQRAESAAPRHAHDWPRRRYNLGFAHYQRYKAPRLSGFAPLPERRRAAADPRDLDLAVEMIREAIQAAPEGEDRNHFQSDLALMLWERYDLSGDPNDLAEAIELKRSLLERTPKSSPQWGNRRGSLGIYLHARFQSEWQIEDLNEAIQALQEALDQAQPGSGEALTWQNNLSVAYRTRFEALGELADLDAAIHTLQWALSATPERSGDRPHRQYNLGLALMSRFDLTQTPQDILDAVAAFEGALTQVTRDDHRWTDYIADLGVAYRRRFEVSRDAADLDRSIACLRQALAAEPKDSSSIPRWMANIARTLLVRYRLGGEQEVLKAAESFLSVAARLLPPRSRDWAEVYSDLGTTMYERHRSGQDEQALAKAMQNYALLLQAYAPAEWPELTCGAAVGLGSICFEQGDWQGAARAFARADQDFEQLYQRQLFSAGRESWISRLGAFYPYFAYAQAKLGDLESAALLLERGRARSLNDALERDQRRLRGLQHRDPQAYRQFQVAVEALRQVAIRERAGQRAAVPNEAGRTLEQIAADARRDLDQATALIRDVPGFEAFLAPPDLQDVFAAALPGQPLVYLLATPRGGLALIAHRRDPAAPPQLSAVWLDDFSSDALHDFLLVREEGQVVGGYLPGQIDRPEWLRRSLSDDLPGLAERLTRPLAEHLKSLAADGVALIPAGLLALLPLHAAGCSAEAQGTCLLEGGVVRFAPSARALSAGAEAAAQAERRRMGAPVLAGVGNPLPAAAPLAFARPEVEGIAAWFDPQASRLLYEQEATLENLQHACQGASYLHFSCHGRFDPHDPLNSSLALSGEDRLTLRDLLDGALDLSQARLVVLSACQTGLTDFTRLPDEAVGLPAGFLQAGAPAVVSSLWPVDDASTALLMERFYRLHLQDGLEPAEALRQAQSWLRRSDAQALGLEAWYRQRYQRSGRRDAQAYKAMRYYAANAEVRPFEQPYYWAGFIFSGV